MKSLIASLRQRLSGRSDSEHGQAAVRLVLVGLILLYALIGLGFGAGAQGRQSWLLLALVMASMVVSLGIFAWLVWRPQRHDTRRVAGMLHDYVFLAAAMLLAGEDMAFAYVVVLWVTVGNGMRYGERWLQAAVAMALVCFGLPLLYAPYWQDKSVLGIGLWIGLAAVPLYIASLLRKVNRATAEARRASQAKTRFLANMSHEFRTPLNGLAGMTDVLAATKLDHEQRECLATIQASTRSLLALVEEVLDISAIEAGKLRMRPVDFSPRELLQSLALVLSPLARGKGLGWRVMVDTDVPETLHGDSAHLRQILTNLLGNAIKFTEHGEVELHVTLVPGAPDGSAVLRLEVRDTGIGVPASLRPRLFDAFCQADDSSIRRHEGTGLGTTIAKGLAEAMGGSIGYLDRAGGGSCFWVELPFATVASPLHAVAPPAAGNDAGSARPAELGMSNVIAFDDPFLRHRARVAPMNILVADDHLANRLVLEKLLGKAGHRVVSVDGAEAVLDAVADSLFDVIIIDLHMPQISGDALLAHLRLLQAGGPQTPVIVLSADVTPEAIERCRSAGAHCFLPKPVVATRLLDTLAGLGGAAAPPEVAVSVPVLVEEFDPSVLDEMQELGLGIEFERQFIAQCVADARRCLQALHNDAQTQNWRQLRENAHAFKGVVAHVGLMRASLRAQELMEAAEPALASGATAAVAGLAELLQRGTVPLRLRHPGLEGLG